MDAVYNSKDAAVILDHSEVWLIKIALDVLRYNDASAKLNGSQLVNLAGLSVEWEKMTADINHKCTSAEIGIERFMSKTVKTLYGDGYSWEVY